MNQATIERFWSKVDKSGGPDACWPWTAGRYPKGYGSFYMRGRDHQSSRVAWVLLNGDPGDLFVCHECDNPPCCNPAHLFLGSNSDNIVDAVQKGRHYSWFAENRGAVRGEKHPAAKLTAADAEAIRADVRPTRELAAEYGVNGSTIRRIRAGTAWGPA